MGKLSNLKEWLTLSEAAQHLSIDFGADVNEADVLRLALDRRLRLSVFFVNHASAKCGKIVPQETSKGLVFATPEDDSYLITLKNVLEGEAGEYVRHTCRMEIGDDECLNLNPKVEVIKGVWDLPMIGAERLDVEHEYQNLTCGPDVTLQCFDGAFVEGRGGLLYQLQEYFGDHEFFDKKNLKQPWDHPKNYYPAEGLPEDSVFVVRTEALREFEQLINGAPTGAEKPMTANERNSLLTIIAALCDYSAIKHQERGVAGQIAKMTEEIGRPVTDETILKVLKKIPDVLASRMK